MGGVSGRRRAYGGVAGDERQADRRRRLLDAGYDLLVLVGPTAVTVTGVCREAGLTSRYFYEHFPNREALLTTILEAEANAVIALIVEAAVLAPDDPQARGEAAVAALLRALDADPRRAELGRHVDDHDFLLRMRATIAQRMTTEFVANAALVWPAAVSRPDRVVLAASLAVGGVLQMILSWLDGETELGREELVRLGARFMIVTGETVLV